MRTPDWQSADGLIALHNCDCQVLLDSMDSRAVDIVVTSPPYNTLQGETGAYGFRAKRKGGTDKFLDKVRELGYEDHKPELVYQAWLANIVANCIRVTRGPVWVNHKLRYRDDVAIFPTDFLRFPVWCRVIWSRRGSMAQNCRKFKPSTEEIYAFGSRGYWSGDPDLELDVWADIAPERGCEDHVCPWPVEIPLRLIRATCPPGGVVLDPFMGRGTAGAATIHARYSRRFVGCDSCPRAFAAAVRNMEYETIHRTPLFNENARLLFDLNREESA